MRAILFGLVLMAAVSVIVLSIRPGGLRRQLRLAARRLRLVLVLGGVYLVFSTVVRVFFSEGWVSDYAPPVVALVLAGAFLVLAQEPALPPETKQ